MDVVGDELGMSEVLVDGVVRCGRSSRSGLTLRVNLCIVLLTKSLLALRVYALDRDRKPPKPEAKR